MDIDVILFPVVLAYPGARFYTRSKLRKVIQIPQTKFVRWRCGCSKTINVDGKPAKAYNPLFGFWYVREE
jgi:hypothetical protein